MRGTLPWADLFALVKNIFKTYMDSFNNGSNDINPSCSGLNKCISNLFYEIYHTDLSNLSSYLLFDKCGSNIWHCDLEHGALFPLS